MNDQILKYDITTDDLSDLHSGGGSVFVTFGETLVRDTPADLQRPEDTRMVHISLAGSEYTVALMLARFGVGSCYITRVPDNPYGWLLRDVARSQGVDTKHIVWADKTEPIGRYIYELGRTPRPSVGWYQRKYSAASRLDSGMVDWGRVLRGSKIFHTSGINFGLAAHSSYQQNYLLQSFQEAMSAKPADCLVGLDYNYRATLWDAEQCKAVMAPLLAEHVDVLVTSIEDMAFHYDISCGHYTADAIRQGELKEISDEDCQDFARQVIERFNVKIVAVTRRYACDFEKHEWESMAMDAAGNFYRSPAVKPIVLLDRLGGGDSWNAGFYYGLLTADSTPEKLEKGILVGDAATRLQQTIMFDLATVSKEEVQTLMKSDVFGGGNRVVR